LKLFSIKRFKNLAFVQKIIKKLSFYYTFFSNEFILTLAKNFKFSIIFLLEKQSYIERNFTWDLLFMLKKKSIPFHLFYLKREDFLRERIFVYPLRDLREKISFLERKKINFSSEKEDYFLLLEKISFSSKRED